MKTLFDSSAFAKRYIDEAGSQTVEDILSSTTELGLCIVCIPEILSAYNRLVREKKLAPSQYRQLKARFSADVSDAVIVDLTPDVLAACTLILEASPVRALDALHVACAVQWAAELFVSADKRQLAAAKKAGLPTISV